MTSKIPIFIITFERLEALKKALNSYRKFFGDRVQFVIHDNGSTYPPLVKFLDQIERRKSAIVFKDQRIIHPRQLNRVNNTVQKYFEVHKKTNYIVTDCDIFFDSVGKELLDFYMWLLDNYLTHEGCEICAVGPMIEIRDIPKHFPLRSQVVKKHRQQFWQTKDRKSVSYKGKEFQITFGFIDTTFAMYRANTQFKRHQWGIRTFEPYMCKHWDWYLHPKRMPPGQRYYTKEAAKRITHWSLGGSF